MKKIVKNNILGVGVSDISQKDVLEYVLESVRLKAKPYYIVTPNPEMIVRAQHDSAFKAVLNEAELSLCDGVGISLAGRILGTPFPERITGVDFMESLCKESVRKPVSIGFLGGKEGVALKTAKCLTNKYPGLQVVFISDEWSRAGFVKAREYKVSSIKYQGKVNEEQILDTEYLIQDTGPVDILFVAFGAPKQERWMADNLGKASFRVAIGVGGAFDYFGGTVKRSPSFLRALGLEWLYRLIRQPWRWRRQLALLEFVRLVVVEWFKLIAKSK